MMLDTPDQKIVAERRKRTIMDMIRSTMSTYRLTKSLWDEALKKYPTFLIEFQVSIPKTTSDCRLVEKLV